MYGLLLGKNVHNAELRSTSASSNMGENCSASPFVDVGSPGPSDGQVLVLLGLETVVSTSTDVDVPDWSIELYFSASAGGLVGPDPQPHHFLYVTKR